MISLFFLFNLVFSFEEYDSKYTPIFDADKPPFLVRILDLDYPDYKPEESKESGKFYFTIAPLVFDKLCSTVVSSSNPSCYKGFFGSHNRYLFSFSYERNILDYFGDFGLKFSAGFFRARGYGFFEGENVKSQESIAFWGFPVDATLVYTFKYLGANQLLVPYVEAGAGIFFFMEAQDAEKTVYGKRTYALYGGGLKLLLDWIDYKSSAKLDLNHGINNSYFVFGYKFLSDIDSKTTMNFSTQYFFTGFILDF